MKRIYRILGVVAVIAVGMTVALYASNPLRRSDDSVREWLLEKVPIGSDIGTLRSVAEREGWRVNGEWSGHQPHADWGGVDGDTVVWIYLGGYRNVFRVDFDSFWAFDENDELTAIATRRMVDAF